MSEPDPKQKAALKDANLLTQLSFGFGVLGIIVLILPKHFMAASADRNEPKQVMGVLFFTATFVLGIWAFIRLLSGPRPFPKGFQILTGIGIGLGIWVSLSFGVLAIPALAGMLVVVGALRENKCIGAEAVTGTLIGCLLPIIIFLGLCAFLR